MNIYILKLTMLIKTIIIVLWTMITSIGIPSFAQMMHIPSEKWLDRILTAEDSDIILPPENDAMMVGTHRAIVSEGDEHTITNISNTSTVITDNETAKVGTLNYIKRVINWALAIVSFVALIVLLVGWFQVVTAAGDDSKLKSWKNAIKKVAIGLAGIAVSWFIVSLIFWVVEKATGW